MKHFTVIGAVLCALPLYAGADTVRPAVGKPLLQAEALMQKGNYDAALAKATLASGVAGLTPYETVVIAQVRGAAAAGAHNYPVAASSYQTVLASGSQPPAVQLQLTQAIAGFYYEEPDYPQAINWVNKYIADGGSDERTRALLPQGYYNQGNYQQAEAVAWREQKAASVSGQDLPESELQLLASAAQKNGDNAGYAAALEALLSKYPSNTYWNQAISRLTAVPDFPDRLILDVYRLRLATGTLEAASDYEDYTERAILAGRPVEADHVIEAGYAGNFLNNQTDSGHAARLRTLAAKESKNTVDQPATDFFGAAIAAYDAGEKDAAVKQFEATPGYDDPDGDATARLARLWVIYLQNNGAAK